MDLYRYLKGEIFIFSFWISTQTYGYPHMDILHHIHIWISIRRYPQGYRCATFRYLHVDIPFRICIQGYLDSIWGYRYLYRDILEDIYVHFLDIFSGYPFRDGDICPGYLGSIWGYLYLYMDILGDIHVQFSDTFSGYPFRDGDIRDSMLWL